MYIPDGIFDLIEPERKRTQLFCKSNGELEFRELDAYELLVDKERGCCYLSMRQLNIPIGKLNTDKIRKED